MKLSFDMICDAHGKHGSTDKALDRRLDPSPKTAGLENNTKLPPNSPPKTERLHDTCMSHIFISYIRGVSRLALT